MDLRCRCASLNDISMQMLCGTEMDDEDSRWDLDSFGLPDGRSQSWSMVGSSDSDDSVIAEPLGDRPPCIGEESPVTDRQINRKYKVNNIPQHRNNTYRQQEVQNNRVTQNKTSNEESKIYSNNIVNETGGLNIMFTQTGSPVNREVKTEGNRKHKTVDVIKHKKKMIVNKLKKFSKQLHSKCSSQSIQLRTLAVL
jgi:hypothetical protein